MPTYEYECQDCGHAFEEFQSMSAESLKDCPQCKKPALQRLIGAGAGIIFKGSGFYETDYKRKEQPKPKSEGASSPSSPSSSDSAGTASSTAKPDSGSAKPSEAKPSKAS